jgi:hypothetical protein
MDLLFEILFEILLEGCFEIISNKNINIVFRKILLSIITIFYLSLILGFIYLSISVSNIFVKIIFIGVIILISNILIRLWIRIYRNKANLK